MSRKPKGPTLVEVIDGLEEIPPARRAQIRAAVVDFYDRMAGEHLVKLGLLSDDELARALARQAEAQGRRHEAWQHLYGALASTTAATLALAGGGRR